MQRPRRQLAASALSLSLLIAACSGGGGEGSAPGSPPPPPPPPPALSPGAFETEASTSRFLTQATFGATSEDITALTGTPDETWFLAQLTTTPSLNLPYVLNELADPTNYDMGQLDFETKQTPTFSFWRNAIEGDDQLRQRMAFALSQILVVSHAEGNFLFEVPQSMAHYQDILVSNAFGNYRDLIEEVTYSPAMGEYLTYLQNTKGDPATGRMPDENYAREVMQLFSIGLLELNQDGSVRVDGGGIPLETYDNSDVTGLARVFTGLSLDDDDFYFDYRTIEPEALYSRMKAFPDMHSDLEKRFLTTTIAAGTGPEESIALALDALVDHPNTPPFISRQLIQRFVTSNPTPEYIERVANAFANGAYTLPSGQSVGEGRRGDLSATIAAILFDEEARNDAARLDDQYGKVREPVIRFINWARTFDASTVTPELTFAMWNTSSPGALAQHPYKSPSVFNFYRPGYVAPGTETGAQGMTMPELQLVNANSVAGFANYMTYFIFAFGSGDVDPERAASMIPDYTDELALADDPQALVDHLDLLLTYGTASPETKQTVVTLVESLPLEVPSDPNYNGPFLRVGLAVLMMMTAPDYVVQR